MHTGMAIGGPLAGKIISSYGPIYKVAEPNEVSYFVPFEQTVDLAKSVVDVFVYEHYRTYGGDVFIPADVINGKRYNHKIYDHPLDYIFSELKRNYRPEVL